MRRSTAPSHIRSRFSSPCFSKEADTEQSTLQQIAAVRSTATIINILSETSSGDSSSRKEEHEDEENITPKIKQENLLNENNVASQMCEKRVFNVVWGKQSKKKHKTWEGDGTLEVGEKSAVLKDMDGKIMGRASGIKTALLQEGSHLYVGNKLVEIIDLKTADVPTTASKNKRPEDSTENGTAQPAKRSRKSDFKLKPLSNPRRPSDSKSLVMPTPSHEHQFKVLCLSGRVLGTTTSAAADNRLRVVNLVLLQRKSVNIFMRSSYPS